MRTPFSQFAGTAEKLSATAEKAGEVVRDSLGLMIGIVVIGVTALVLSVVAILLARGAR